VDPTNVKWLIALRVGDGERIHGYLGPKLMEATQVGHHLWTGRYLGYAGRWALGAGRAAMLGSALFDRSAREAARAWIRSGAASPLAALRRENLQSVLIIQHIDLGPDGQDNMCDCCPDMTFTTGSWSGRAGSRSGESSGNRCARCCSRSRPRPPWLETRAKSARRP
jgi:hypothetical protein